MPNSEIIHAWTYSTYLCKDCLRPSYLHEYFKWAVQRHVHKVVSVCLFSDV